MKKITLSILMLVAVSLSGIAAAAAAPPRQSRTTESRTPETQERQGSLPASTVLGLRVRDPSGQAVGTVVDLLIDEEAGRITHVIVSVGDLLALVPWSDLMIQGNRDRQPMERDPQTGVSVPQTKAPELPPGSFRGYQDI